MQEFALWGSEGRAWQAEGTVSAQGGQCSCLENPRDRGAWWAAVYGVAQSRTRLKRLSSSSSVMTKVCSYRLAKLEEPPQRVSCPDRLSAWAGSQHPGDQPRMQGPFSIALSLNQRTSFSAEG